MTRLLERLGDRMLDVVLPSAKADAAYCYGLNVGACAWICCNTTCTVEKRCCLGYGSGVCTCSACQHA
ncbi:hypothetical protein J2S43_007200 [Catenuloplanes nepalensis]|uniref:Uncharacterized protein n=1 Tax=Catenuloplanes nepalensis TaxID=587533 RepID=A0ABT9N4R0_9ACTN|nr:hypothetical protein [Catenuloplanes nepalensis]